MARTSLTIEQILSQLEATPDRIATATAGMTPAQLRRAEARGEWSVRDVLAHLRSCADARGEFIRAILADDRPARRAIDPRTWIEQTDYLELEFELSFRSFRRQRARLLAYLRSLAKKAWSARRS